jgi:hypothetical protein
MNGPPIYRLGGDSAQRLSYAAAWVATMSITAVAGKARGSGDEPILGTDDLDVEVEYEDGFLSQFPIVGATTRDGVLEFHLTTKHTDCLAKESCMPANEGEAACCSGGGCC